MTILQSLSQMVTFMGDENAIIVFDNIAGHGRLLHSKIILAKNINRNMRKGLSPKK